MDRKKYYPEDIEYEKRGYREVLQTNDLVLFPVLVKETDLLVRAEKDLSEEVKGLVLKYRNQVEKYIEEDPDFKTILGPYTVNREAPEIVQDMAKFSSHAGVGPMAGVAGAMAEFIGKDLLPLSYELILEN